MTRCLVKQPARRPGRAPRHVDVDQAWVDVAHQAVYLTRDEESDLAVKAKAGDLDARDKLFMSQARWVIDIACKFINHRHYDINDMVQAGNMGLLRAIDQFEPSYGYRLSTYATNWIRQSIQREIAGNCSTVRVPIYFTTHKPRDDRSFTDSARSALRCTREVAYTIPTNQNDDPCVLAGQQEEMAQAVENIKASASKSISDIEADVLIRRVVHKETLHQVGKAHGITRERVRQIQRKAANKLRAVVAGDEQDSVDTRRRGNRAKSGQIRELLGGLVLQ